MTDMRPWLEEETEAEIAELLRAGRPAEPLDDAVRERSRRRIRTLDRPRRRAGSLEALPAAAGVLVWVKHAALGAGLGIIVSAGAAAPRLIQHFSTPAAPASSSARARPTPAPIRPPAPVAPTPEERASPAQAPSGSIAAYPDTNVGGDDFELELLLLERAKAELKRDPEVALRTLHSHRADFAKGKLALERDFLTVTTLVRLGRLVEARGYADSLRARAPGNIYDERLRQLLGDPARSP